MKKLFVLAPCAALLFGCSGGLFGGNVSLQPGQWESTVQFTTIDMPGAPPGAAEAMRAMLGQPQTRSSCMSAEEAANPSSRFASPEVGNAGCTFEENGFANGTINVRGTCSNPQRGNLQMTMTGNYTATTMEATINQTMTAPPNTPGPQSIRLEGRMTARRTGDCTTPAPAVAPTAPGNAG